MSSFGGIPFEMLHSRADYIISCANKCLEGVPGFAFVIARKDHLTQCRGRGLSLDLLTQWKTLESTGQFRFTPPVHAMAALTEALQQLHEEGGIIGRQER